MFGYIQPDSPYLFIKDEKLYKAVYCGMCKSIGKCCGSVPKTALSYDIAFLSCLLHNAMGCDFKIKKRHCWLHIFRRRYMAEPDELSLLLGCVNTALAYHKLLDDKADGEARGAFSFIYKAGYKRVLKKHPKVAEIISRNMAMQREAEAKNTDNIDEACEATAMALKELTIYALGERSTDSAAELLYYIGKWIYLADALDDYDTDVKKGRFNVLYNAFKCQSKAEAVEKNAEEINFLFNALFADMRLRLKNVKFAFNHDLTDNIILRGIPQKTRSLVYGRCEQGKKAENVAPKGEV